MSHDDKRVKSHSGIDNEFIVCRCNECGEPSRFPCVYEKKHDVCPFHNPQEGLVILFNKRRWMIWHRDR